MTRHLSPRQFLDAAEGVPAPDAVAHLRECNRCRLEALALSETVSTVADTMVPEPSPLFWQHFSARVSEAIAAEGVTGAPSSWRLRWSYWPVAAGTAIAAVLLAVNVVPRLSPAATPVASSAARQVEALPVVDDESLRVLSDLAGDLSWDDATEAGFSMSQGAVDRVVADMPDSERVELERLLSAELADLRKAL